MLMAIRARANHLSAPAITLYAAFPPTPHVGDVDSFGVTATLANGATGTLTITVDVLPAGLTLGATTMVDATHYKATVSGTLTTVQNVTSTFGATGGSVGATPLVHAFNVTAASTGVIPVGTPAALSGPGSSIPIPSGCQAGDLMLLSYISNVAPTMPTGSTAIVADAVTWTPTFTNHTGSYGYFLTSADITAGSVAWTNNAFTAATASFWRSVHASIVDVQSALNKATTVAPPQTLSAAGITTTVNGDMLVFTGILRSNGSVAGTFTTASGFTVAVNNTASGSRSLTVQYQAQATAGAVSGPSCTFNNGNTAAWAANLVALKPA
jgi:hypothetical protein